MQARMRLVLPGAALAAIITLAPLALADPPDTTEPPVVTVTATDFLFDAPDRMPSGAVTIRLVNKGEALHHAQLVRLDEGRTPEDLAEADATGELPSWATFVGGPGLIAPGMEATATVELRPGTYYWLCFVETDGMPHMAQGMVHRTEVQPGDRVAMPKADNTMMLNDYEFKLGKVLTAGHHVIRVRNTAAQPHEAILVRFAPGKTMDDLMAFVAGGGEGDPPGVPMGGMQALSQGLAADMVVDLEPGNYGLICFVPDVADGQPHAAHGMVQEFSIE